MKLNENYKALQESYLFAQIAHKVSAFQAQHPEKEILRLGIGDVTQPIVPAVIQAMHNAVTDMGTAETFHGYGPEQGYLFLREAIADYYKSKQVHIAPADIFVSDGAKSDLGNLSELFAQDCTVLISNPVYPVYVDTNLMAGRKIIFAKGTPENQFLPMPEQNVSCDVIYLCSPNNPTGAVYTKQQLAQWVAYARAQNAVILFDAAYEAFVRSDTLPTSIYQIEHADTCAIEICSFSKLAGFTGLRCGYTVVPRSLQSGTQSLHDMWLRRQTTKTNGVSYITQCGAAAIFTDEGLRQIRTVIDGYLQNAHCMADTFSALGIWHTGGDSSPYLWIKCPENFTSWQYFDFLLEHAGIVGTPGTGFGTAGEGYFRFSAFAAPHTVRTAMQRLKKITENS